MSTQTTRGDRGHRVPRPRPGHSATGHHHQTHRHSSHGSHHAHGTRSDTLRQPANRTTGTTGSDRYRLHGQIRWPGRADLEFAEWCYLLTRVRDGIRRL